MFKRPLELHSVCFFFRFNSINFKYSFKLIKWLEQVAFKSVASTTKVVVQKTAIVAKQTVVATSKITVGMKFSLKVLVIILKFEM